MATQKKCFKCKVEWPLIFFYKHKKMQDGHLNKCKKCTKKDVNQHRQLNIEKIREYDQRRSKTPKRKAHIINTAKEWRIKNPEKYKAHNKLNNAVRDGKIKKMPCCVCGDARSQGHHEDYSRPLDVIWLCAKHHHNL